MQRNAGGSHAMAQHTHTWTENGFSVWWTIGPVWLATGTLPPAPYKFERISCTRLWLRVYQRLSMLAHAGR